MRKIIVGFSCPKKFKVGASLIKWWIKKKYSHVYIRYTDNQGRDLVFHAANGNVHQMTFDNFTFSNKVVSENSISIDESRYQKFRDIFYSVSGLLYSTTGLLTIPIYDILWKFGYTLKSENDTGYICSELVGYTLSEILDIKWEKPYNLLRPDDIEKGLVLWLSTIEITK